MGSGALVQAAAQGQRPSERVEAILRLKRSVAQHPEDVTARVELGNALDDTGDSAGAIAQYREAIRIEPKFARAYRNLALAYIRQGQWAAAESAARDAVRIEPNYVQARCDLAMALSNQRKAAEAAREWRQAIGRGPAEVSRYWGFDRAPAKQQEFKRATPEIAVQFLIGLSLRSSREHGAAIREIQKTLEMDNNFALAHLELAQLYSESGKPKEAAAELQKAAELNAALRAEFEGTTPEKSDTELKKTIEAQRKELSAYREMIPTLIAALHTKGIRGEQRTKSRALLQESAIRVKRILDAGPEDQEGFLLLGDALRELEEPRAAWAYETSIRAARRSGQAGFAGRAWMGLGLLQQKAGHDAAAMEMFSQGMLASPEDPELLNAAAWLAATSANDAARNPQKAVEWAKKAVEETKEKNAAYLSTLAEAYFASGQTIAAVRTVGVAMFLEPEETKYREQMEKLKKAGNRD
jgi:tetratricopeptide (TPR) repeat protein